MDWFGVAWLQLVWFTLACFYFVSEWQKSAVINKLGNILLCKYVMNTQTTKFIVL
jgi:hypothetical protein